MIAAALIALIAGFEAKLGYELVTGTTLFVDSSAAGFTPLPLVHAVGGLVGCVFALRDPTSVSVLSTTRNCKLSS